MRRILIISFLFLTLVGCQTTGFLMASAKVVMLNDACPAKSEQDNIEVYYTNTPNKEYIELAQITCSDTDDAWCIKQIKIKAREIGADGLIIIGKSATDGIAIPIGSMYYISEESYGIKAIAIKYVDNK